MSIENCRLIELPKLSDKRGHLSFIENHRHIPFEMKRIYYLYDVPLNEERGGHAHKELHQLIIAIAGSFNIVLDDGNEKKIFHLSKPFEGLYVSPMIWREILNFSQGAVCLVLASDFYDEEDYYRNYQDFLLGKNLR